ncbi:amylo-alpha-1,6-glucosidase [Acidicapsa dinghuensis]
MPRPVFEPVAAFPLTQDGLVISRPAEPAQPFTVAGPRGVVVGTQEGTFESWVLPVKLLSHITIEANIEGYPVPIPVNDHAANIEVRPDHTTITYSHPGFTLRQIMFSPADAGGSNEPSTGPVVMFQIDALHPTDFVFRFTPEMQWMWPRRNDGIPGADWVASVPPVPTNSTEEPAAVTPGYYVLHMDYPDLAGAVTIPGAVPGVMAPYQERPQVHPLELRLHYDPKRDGNKFFPLLMAVGTTAKTASEEALGEALKRLNDNLAADYEAEAKHYREVLASSTKIDTPDKKLNEAFQWAVVSIEHLRTLEYPGSASPQGVTSPEMAMVAGYYQSADSARPGFGWFFGRDALYTLYAVNGFGDFALTRSELEFLMRRQRADGKIMHEYSQTANDPTVDWKAFPYMYAAADATPLFLMTVRDYYRASGDLDFLKAHREAIEKAWAFETDAAHDTDHDGIYDNSQGTGWVESWPGAMPHQEVYLALLDEQASRAFGVMETALGDSTKADAAQARAKQISETIEREYYDAQKGCYAFATNPAGQPNSPADHTRTVYPAIAYWDDGAALAHPEACLSEWAAPAIDTDWGTRDVADDEPYYDGMSYHQGSVWPLFTGWAALAEYRAGQPLAGEQLLMQNVDLTWAQDPGAVTELLSGDYFIPFGRSTSHQLWSSAMVITPILRGLFGIELDAAANVVTVNPHLPAWWAHAAVSNLHLGNKVVDLSFDQANDIDRPNSQDRANALLTVSVYAPEGGRSELAKIKLRSDIPGVRGAGAGTHRNSMATGERLQFPAPAVEPILPEHSLPVPGSRTAQLKVLSEHYEENELTLEFSGTPDSSAILYLRQNGPYRRIQIKGDPENRGEAAKLLRSDDDLPSNTSASDPRLQLWFLQLHFPRGDGWQTMKVTLTW